MAKTHWKKFQNPDYIGAYAFDENEEKVLTIDHAQKENYTGNGGKKDEGLVVHFKERDVKPLICNSTNAKRIEKVAKSPFIEDWPGTRIQLYTEMVTAFGETGLAVRVRDFAPKEEICCDYCGVSIRASDGKSPRQIATSTKKRYGAELCADCARKRFEEKKSDEAKEEPVNEDNED
ncbi:MAG: hypothetical protein RSD88_06920 [Anaerovoracaceae bacterium]